MFAPCHLTSPSAGASSPHKIRSKLVLPLPFGPVSWTSVPGDTAKSSSLKSLRSPRTHPSLLSSSIVGCPPEPLYAEPQKGTKGHARADLSFRFWLHGAVRFLPLIPPSLYNSDARETAGLENLR